MVRRLVAVAILIGLTHYALSGAVRADDGPRAAWDETVTVVDQAAWDETVTTVVTPAYAATRMVVDVPSATVQHHDLVTPETTTTRQVLSVPAHWESAQVRVPSGYWQNVWVPGGHWETGCYFDDDVRRTVCETNWSTGHFETQQQLVTSGYWTSVYVDTSHYESQPVWVVSGTWAPRWIDTSYWDSVQTWVSSGYWNQTWVSTAHYENVWSAPGNYWVCESDDRGVDHCGYQWFDGYWYQQWVNSGYWQQSWVDTSHWEWRSVWVADGYWQSYWQDTSHYESQQVWVSDGHYEPRYVDTSHYVPHQVWVEEGSWQAQWVDTSTVQTQQTWVSDQYTTVTDVTPAIWRDWDEDVPAVTHTETVEIAAVTHTETVHHDAVTHTETVHHEAVAAARTLSTESRQGAAPAPAASSEPAARAASLVIPLVSTLNIVDQPAYDETLTVVDAPARSETRTVVDSPATTLHHHDLVTPEQTVARQVLVSAEHPEAYSQWVSSGYWTSQSYPSYEWISETSTQLDSGAGRWQWDPVPPTYGWVSVGGGCSRDDDGWWSCSDPYTYWGITSPGGWAYTFHPGRYVPTGFWQWLCDDDTRACGDYWYEGSPVWQEGPVYQSVDTSHWGYVARAQDFWVDTSHAETAYRDVPAVYDTVTDVTPAVWRDWDEDLPAVTHTETVAIPAQTHTEQVHHDAVTHPETLRYDAIVGDGSPSGEGGPDPLSDFLLFAGLVALAGAGKYATRRDAVTAAVAEWADAGNALPLELAPILPEVAEPADEMGQATFASWREFAEGTTGDGPGGAAASDDGGAGSTLAGVSGSDDAPPAAEPPLESDGDPAAADPSGTSDLGAATSVAAAGPDRRAPNDPVDPLRDAGVIIGSVLGVAEAFIDANKKLRDGVSALSADLRAGSSRAAELLPKVEGLREATSFARSGLVRAFARVAAPIEIATSVLEELGNDDPNKLKLVARGVAEGAAAAGGGALAVFLIGSALGATAVAAAPAVLVVGAAVALTIGLSWLGKNLGKAAADTFAPLDHPTSGPTPAPFYPSADDDKGRQRVGGERDQTGSTGPESADAQRGRQRVGGEVDDEGVGPQRPTPTREDEGDPQAPADDATPPSAPSVRDTAPGDAQLGGPGGDDRERPTPREPATAGRPDDASFPWEPPVLDDRADAAVGLTPDERSDTAPDPPEAASPPTEAATDGGWDWSAEVAA